MSDDQAPAAPVDVHLLTEAGESMAVECAYRGLEDGIHIWEVVTPVPDGFVVREMTVAEFPPKTSIQFPFKP